MVALAEELPFTIPTPPDYEAFSRLVAGRGPADLDTAVRRIRITNRQQLAAGSKQGLQVGSELYSTATLHFCGMSQYVGSKETTAIEPMQMVARDLPFGPGSGLL